VSAPGPPGTPDDLGRRFLLGGLQLGAGQWLSTALNFVILLGVARLLGPEAFGLYAYVFAISAVLDIVGAFSLNIALIQAREASQSLFDTAAVASLALGLIGLLAAAGIAPALWAAHSPVAAWMLVALAVARVLRLLAQVPQAHLERELRYGPLTVIGIVTGNVPNLIALALAWWGIGAWSLVVRDLLMTGLLLAMTGIWSAYTFRGEMSRAALHSLSRISRRLFAAVSVGAAAEHVDRVSIGAFLGNTATGLYQQARQLGELGNLATRPVSRVALNAYARVQDNRGRLSRSHELLNMLLVRLVFAGAVSLLCFPGPVILLLLGEAWVAAAPLLQIFGVFAAVIPLTENVRVLFYGTGHVDRNLRVALLQLGWVLPGVGLGCWLGSTQAVAWAVTASAVIAFLGSWWWSRDLVERQPLQVFAAPVGALLACVAGFAGLEAAGLLAWAPVTLLPFLAPLGYAVLLLAAERSRLVALARYLRQLMTGTPG